MPRGLGNQTSHSPALAGLDVTGTKKAEILYGLNTVLAALRVRGNSCHKILLADSRKPGPAIDEIRKIAQSLGPILSEQPKNSLDRYGDHHQGVVAFFAPRPDLTLSDLIKSIPAQGPAMILALDHLEDPHNLGALLRSAAAFGIKGVLIPRDRAAGPSQAVYAASAGGAETVPLVRVVNLARAIETLTHDMGFWLVAAEGGQGQALSGFSFPERTIFILGSEGKGLGQNLLGKADFVIHIPMAESQVNSLNVSNAGAIVMHAFFSKFFS